MCGIVGFFIKENINEAKLRSNLSVMTNSLSHRGPDDKGIFFDKEYFCYMTGFIAGMPFLGDLDKNLRAKRLETPRVKVPKGSVGLTEQFANIYTFESPGGWNIIGNSPKKVFTKDPTKLTLIDPGDEVEFFEISKKEYSKFNEQK